MSLGHPSRPSGILPLGSVTRVRFRRLPLRLRRGRFWDVRSLSCGVCRGGPPSFLSFSLGGTSERRTLVRSWRISTLKSGTKPPGSKTNHRPPADDPEGPMPGDRLADDLPACRASSEVMGPFLLTAVARAAAVHLGSLLVLFFFIFLLLLIEKGMYFC